MDDEELLIGKFSNIFIKLIVGIMSNNIEDIKHYLSDELYTQIQSMINTNISNNEIRCFDEPNISDVIITSREQDEKYDIVNVELTSKYMDYYIDSNSLSYLRGINDHRIVLTHNLVFKKLKESEIINIAIKCPTCGASLNPSDSGYCSYCGKTNSAESYDYVLYEVTNL